MRSPWHVRNTWCKFLTVQSRRKAGSLASLRPCDAGCAPLLGPCAACCTMHRCSVRAARPAAEEPPLTLLRPSRAPLVNAARRSFATEKPAAKPAGKPGAAAPAGGKAAAAAPPSEDAGIPQPPPPPSPPKTPHDPSNPLHAKYPGLPLNPPGTIPEHVQKIAEAIARLNMIEAAQLNLVLQQQLGITEEQVKGWFGSMSGGVVYAAPPPGAAAPGGAAAGAAAGAPPKEEKKEKSAFNLKLVKIEESQKIKILKEIRVLRPGMNLAEVRSRSQFRCYCNCTTHRRTLKPPVALPCCVHSVVPTFSSPFFQTKALTDKLPSLLKEGVPKEEAESWVKKLKEVGATVELE